MKKTLLLSLAMLAFTAIITGQTGNPMELYFYHNSSIEPWTITLPLYGDNLNVTVDWDDGSALEVITVPGDYSHNYQGDDNDAYVKIYGHLEHFGNSTTPVEQLNLTTVVSYGDVANSLTSLAHAFWYASKLGNIPAALPSGITDLSYTFYFAIRDDTPPDVTGWDVSNVTNMEGAFMNSYSFNQDITGWDVSKVTNMKNLFYTTDFNQEIGTWDVSKVTTMEAMFSGCDLFNGDISTWDVSSVTTMKGMFQNAWVFNQDISTKIVNEGGPGEYTAWDVSKVEDMSRMFENTTGESPPFNQPIGNWNVGNVTNMEAMFLDASEFNQNLNSWDVSKVENMSGMFSGAENFNGNISSWDVSNVTTMDDMFSGASAFNQDVSTKIINEGTVDEYTAWDVSNVTTMENLFQGAAVFNIDISNWNVSSVTSMENMFRGAEAFNIDIGNWNTSNVLNMGGMFAEAYAFNQDISTKIINQGTPEEYTAWDVSSVTDMGEMFAGDIDNGTYTIFNQNTSNWDVSNVTSLESMFAASNFNQDIGNWRFADGANLYIMFGFNTSFNQDISGWNITAGTKINGMFVYATAFDQNIGSWDITGADPLDQQANLSLLFLGAGLSTANFNALLTGWAAQDVASGVTLSAGSSRYSTGGDAQAAFNTLTSAPNNWNIGFDEGNGQATSVTWDGSEGSDWNTAANWVDGVVPTKNEEAILTTDGTAPVISSGVQASCNTLTVNNGVTLTINAGGSLITNDAITNNGTISIKQTLADDNKWHFIAMPNNNTTAATFDGMYLQKWDETVPQWQDVTETSTALTPVKGYSLWVANGTKGDFTYTGTPNSGDQSLSLTNSGSETHSGMNFVGNPYPSGIDWNMASSYGSKYTWNGTGYDAYVAADGYGDGSRYVDPMEGFFIYSEDASGTLSLNNNMRVHNNGGKQDGKKELQNGLVLTASGGEYHDNLWLIFRANASAGFDLDRDAWKLLSSTEGISQLWSVSPDGILAVDVRPETGTIQLGFTNDEAGFYTIGIKEIADLPEAILEDTKTNILHDLTKGAYEFAWDINDDETRFKLHLNAVGIEETPANESNILIYASNNQILIKGAEAGQVKVCDLMGRVVLEKEITSSETFSIPINLQTGIYLVTVQNGKEIKTVKVYIR